MTERSESSSIALYLNAALVDGDRQGRLMCFLVDQVATEADDSHHKNGDHRVKPVSTHARPLEMTQFEQQRCSGPKVHWLVVSSAARNAATPSASAPELSTGTAPGRGSRTSRANLLAISAALSRPRPARRAARTCAVASISTTVSAVNRRRASATAARGPLNTTVRPAASSPMRLAGSP